MTVTDRIRSFNRDRYPSLLALKYERMRDSVFAFFRGTCHLFYEDWPTQTPFNHAPQIWICGDLHLQNFGTHKGRDGEVYFDLNDFDEAALAPCTWDLARVVTSIIIGTRPLGFKRKAAYQLGQQFLEVYRQTLLTNSLDGLAQITASGAVKDLIVNVKDRDRQSFLDQWTILEHNQRTLKQDSKRMLPVTSRIDPVLAAFETWAAEQSNPEMFRVLDVAVRVAGTGSLGLERLILLVQGNGSPERNRLMDLKVARGSAVQPHFKTSPLPWSTQADRIVAFQQALQYQPPALLTSLSVHLKSYVLRELQPAQAQLDWEQFTSQNRIENVISALGQVTAWAHLRGSGLQGTASRSCLMAFAQALEWQEPLLNYGLDYSRQVKADYRYFCQHPPEWGYSQSKI